MIYELFQGRTEKLATYTGDVYHVVVSTDEATRRTIYPERAVTRDGQCPLPADCRQPHHPSG